jgi:hypothetical protein
MIEGFWEEGGERQGTGGGWWGGRGVTSTDGRRAGPEGWSSGG